MFFLTNQVKIALAHRVKEDVSVASKTAKKNQPQNSDAPRKPSKREKRQKFIIYLMIISMLLTSLLAGASMFL
nr:stressosome-associated protein Prli42 [Pontibacillus yanchengensis]